MTYPPVVVQATPTLRERFVAVDWLNPDERDRLARFRRPQDRDDFRAAHHLARELAAAQLGLADPAALDLRQRCPHCDRPHGRPTVLLAGAPAPVHVSWAHSDGWVAAVAADTPVGVDVEARRLTPEALAATARTVCTPAEQRLLAESADPATIFARLWVVKEALVKVGRTILDDLAQLDASPALGGRAVLTGALVQLRTEPQPHALAVLPG